MATSNAKPTYYLDSSVFIDLIEHPADQEPAKTIAAIIGDADDGRVKLVTSIITIAEVWHAKAEVDNAAPNADVEQKISRLWNPSSSPIWLVDVHEQIAREAVALLRSGIQHGWRKTQGVDGVHLATAKREGVDEFLTTEKAMDKWGPILGFKVCPPHRDTDLFNGTQP